VEAAEPLEALQWLSDESSKALSSDQAAKVREEIADVFLYLVRFADKLDVNLLKAAEVKMASNALKYPADKSRGSNKKYIDL
jgi:NTP pyrophosphatase (non-canonical NTP hydrolase)